MNINDNSNFKNDKSNISENSLKTNPNDVRNIYLKSV